MWPIAKVWKPKRTFSGFLELVGRESPDNAAGVSCHAMTYTVYVLKPNYFSLGCQELSCGESEGELYAFQVSK